MKAYNSSEYSNEKSITMKLYLNDGGGGERSKKDKWRKGENNR